MSKRNWRPKPKPVPGDVGVITVLSDLAPDGRTYIATVHLDDDTAVTLDRDRATAWATAVLAAAAEAEHDARVLRQLTEILHTTTTEAVHVIGDLRSRRPPRTDATTAPLRLESGVTLEGRPFLILAINGQRVGQWTCTDARGFAQHVLEVNSAVDLDTAYHRYLTEQLGLDPAQARDVITGLAHVHPAPEQH